MCQRGSPECPPAEPVQPRSISPSPPNPDPAPRSANIIIGGQTFSRDAGRGRVQLFAQPDQPQRGGRRRPSSFDVNTSSNCGWTSSGVPAWITGCPASGTGTTPINFTVAANPDATPRNANITIAGQTFAVSQAAAACGYALNPPSHNATAGGGSSSFAVNTTSGCGWTSSGVPAWITGVPANGTGTTTINFTVTANPDPAPRTANISIGGQPFTVTQDAAAACSYSLNPTSRNPAAAGGASSVRDQRPRRAATGRAAVCRRGSREYQPAERGRQPSISPSPPTPTPLRAVPTSPSAARPSP